MSAHCADLRLRWPAHEILYYIVPPTQGSRLEHFAEPELKNMRRQKAGFKQLALLFIFEVLEATNGTACRSVDATLYLTHQCVVLLLLHTIKCVIVSRIKTSW